MSTNCNAVINPFDIFTQKQTTAFKSVLTKHKYSLLSGGSRSGKTFLLCATVAIRANQCKSRHAVLRFHFNDVKQSVGMDTLPKVLELFGMNGQYELNKSDWVFTFRNGSEIWLCGLDDKERTEKILGKEFTTIYLNEASQISYQSYQMALTRLAENSGLTNRVFVDCNPPTKDHWLYALFVMHKDPNNRNLSILHPENYGYMDVNPLDNVANLPEGYIDDVLSGLDERQRARFRDGVWLDRRQGSLWSFDMIQSNRVEACPQLRRIVVGVDPAVTSNADSDETGIVVAGIGYDGHLYILGDYSLSASPNAWATVVKSAFDKHKCDRVVAEVNQGGDMVESTIRSVCRSIPYKSVRATRGKAIRAEPIAAMYEQGKVHHVGILPELESQMLTWDVTAPDSPDRMDALVWACTELTSKTPAYQKPIIM